jgi:hypothetical protein
VKKLMAVVLVSLLLVPVLAGPAQAWGGRGGWHGGGHGGWRGGCCWGGFALGLGIGALATAPFWYPPAYAYPAYAYPAYGYPAYGYPGYSYPAYSYQAYPAPPAYPPPAAPPADPGAMTQPSQSTGVTYGTPPSNPPSVQGSAPAPTGGQNCYTVTVEGHNETRTLQSGQSVTAWVPTYTQQVCQ